MPLPPMTEEGGLPEGVHLATLMEVIERFGQGTTQRHIVTRRLMNIHENAKQTKMMSGSYRAEIEKMHREVMEYLATPLQKVSA